MMRSTSLSAIRIATLAIMVTGCATRPELPSPPRTLHAQECSPGRCTITVTVREPCDQPGNVLVDKELVEAREAVNMVWVLNDQRYEFNPGGIFFVPPSDQFQIQQGASSKHRIVVHNKKTDVTTTEHYYLVSVKGCWPLDPWVRNTR
jgi:hypothetical protein